MYDLLCVMSLLFKLINGVVFVVVSDGLALRKSVGIVKIL